MFKILKFSLKDLEILNAIFVEMLRREKFFYGVMSLKKEFLKVKSKTFHL